MLIAIGSWFNIHPNIFPFTGLERLFIFSFSFQIPHSGDLLCSLHSLLTSLWFTGFLFAVAWCGHLIWSTPIVELQQLLLVFSLHLSYLQGFWHDYCLLWIWVVLGFISASPALSLLANWTKWPLWTAPFAIAIHFNPQLFHTLFNSSSSLSPFQPKPSSPNHPSLIFSAKLTLNFYTSIDALTTCLIVSGQLGMLAFFVSPLFRFMLEIRSSWLVRGVVLVCVVWWNLDFFLR